MLKTLRHLKVELFFSDDWSSYSKYIPKEHHDIGKRNTQKIECKFLTFRTKIKQLARKSICFSKTELMHDTVIGLYINPVEWDQTYKTLKYYITPFISKILEHNEDDIFKVKKGDHKYLFETIDSMEHKSHKTIGEKSTIVDHFYKMYH